MAVKYSDVDPLDAEVIVGGVIFDRWILGEGVDSDIEYLVHLSEPRFIAKVADGVEAPPSQGLTVVIGDTSFYDILWIDPPITDEEELRNLFRAADEAIERDMYKPEPETGNEE